MRIIGGNFRGRALASVGKGDAGAHLRPTTDRVRESLFNVLTGGRFGDPITDARVLDLFAGTGALGLEALSRGASHVTFVDDGRKSNNLIRQNIAICQAQKTTKLIRRDARKLPACPTDPFDLIFLDPPYGKSLGEKALQTALANGWVAPESLIVWEENTAITPPECVTLLDDRHYGDTTIFLLEYTA
ncbi:16S rRNA (guanine(966)-N(2))-methyltransferase RsmD [Alisedimentitalea sp. MJ-SS2]|uniref:16S rRNA (guanine(966)-N(2))-methyltransferase RsmD n=1 Tax=Aliisedimentitalea sp. MJ-SS2 TaxID=3049795 RepID=UPI002913F9BD|nr:16S rRNA (guanine(966)-N(2))-methyltransferase RsmD [Alisedimentitalea sp. MJ-SS2]MDU8927624.1 16S rRNA (guanine(966)-N(2))-methyltransferase RsmD [Alisedimentitalea sp. MJ-SS2]